MAQRMKFIMGFIAGLTVGTILASTPADQQRTRAAEAAARATRRVQDSRVGRAVSSNASQVSNAVDGRAADAVDHIGDSLTDTIRATT